MDDGRRCALPGCEVGIDVVAGRPERRYCTPAHREAARRARRAAMQVQRAAAGDLAGTLPWLRADEPRTDVTGPVLRPPSAVPPAWEIDRPDVVRTAVSAHPGAVAEAAARRSRQGHRADVRPRRRALAVLGVAGLLTGGYAVAAHPDAPPAAGPAQTAPGDGSSDAWAQRADVALAGVNRQLAVLDQAEQQWDRLPASRRDDVPAPVAALRERRAVLEQRRGSLQSQLETYRSLQATRQDLADSEQRLRTVEQALADAAPADRRTEAERATVAALDDQRDLRIRQRDAQRAEVASLEQGVASAAQTPLPADDEETAQVSRDVLDVVAGNGGTGSRRAAPPSSTGPAPSTGPTAPPTTTRTPSRTRDGSDGSSRRRPTTTTRPAPPTTIRPTTATDDDVLTRLHEQAREVARQARRAEAARRADAARAAEPTAPAAAAPTAVPDPADDADDDTVEERNAARHRPGHHPSHRPTPAHHLQSQVRWYASS